MTSASSSPADLPATGASTFVAAVAAAVLAFGIALQWLRRIGAGARR